MIFSGYENGHYFLRLTSDVRMVELAGVLYDGYKLMIGHMLLLKKREPFELEFGFEESDRDFAYEV